MKGGRVTFERSNVILGVSSNTTPAILRVTCDTGPLQQIVRRRARNMNGCRCHITTLAHPCLALCAHARCVKALNLVETK